MFLIIIINKILINNVKNIRNMKYIKNILLILTISFNESVKNTKTKFISKESIKGPLFNEEFEESLKKKVDALLEKYMEDNKIKLEDFLNKIREKALKELYEKYANHIYNNEIVKLIRQFSSKYYIHINYKKKYEQLKNNPEKYQKFLEDERKRYYKKKDENLRKYKDYVNNNKKYLDKITKDNSQSYENLQKYKEDLYMQEKHLEKLESKKLLKNLKELFSL
jgi:hypothetical protein